MNQKDFIYNAVYKGSLQGGAGERAAVNHAVMALDDYRKNKFQGRVSRLIEDRIKQAKKVKG